MDRRIRHVTAIQIRNLTPFPARDSLASALTQPAEHSQFTSHGHLSDDLDVTIQRKRSRRISVNSVATHRSLLSEDGSRDEGSSVAPTERGRRTSGPRVSFPSDGGDIQRQHSSSGSMPTIRPNRARTNSMASSIGSYIPGPSAGSLSTSTAGASFSAMLPDNSQTGLEKVINSRLVETFLTITIPEPPAPTETSNAPPHPLKSPPFREKLSASKSVEGTLPHNAIKLHPPADKFGYMRRDSSTSPLITPKPFSSHTKSASTSVIRTNGEAKRVTPHPPPLNLAKKASPKLEASIPNYFSPIHRPSTNPYFVIDAHSNRDFTEGTDCSGHKMKIEVWGRVGCGWRGNVTGKGKEKEVDSLEADMDWKILEERDVDLRDLIPLSESSVPDLSQLPSNSLLITLSPPGTTFYLPPHIPSHERSPSPSTGYASDPESDARRMRPTDLSSPFTVTRVSGQNNDTGVAPSRRRHRIGVTDIPAVDITKTAGWQDLFKLVTLQSCILDNERSLSEVVLGIDNALEDDSTFVQRREVSEREARVEELSIYRKKVIDESHYLRIQIQERHENLQRRKQFLRLAREQLEEEIESEYEKQHLISQDRAEQLSIRSRFAPTRTTLLSILSSIYPIELLSPPDLLYTILDVPLPIPLTPSDPAPPLTLPSHKDVHEESVATSLGYAAQVTQLLAAYLGKPLVYPVTCIGSRSLIKDNISAMVGPRMFPLYSKGVDTYRFEYGVFLLNKNIELLMADRDLRALDMRHTLPNLKNLLLILTDGEGARLQQIRPPGSPISLSSELGASSLPGSPTDPNSTTPKASNKTALDGHSPPASGSTTPTAATADSSKKNRPFLAFSPLTDFWRGRYPSSTRISIKAGPDAEDSEESEERQSMSVSLDPSSEQQNNADDDDDDRKTISDIVSFGHECRLKSSSIANGSEKKAEEENVGHSSAHVTPIHSHASKVA
ncbi:hypothetical protein H0H81_005129 [Sphagnurus paluster]|uniref:Autophagy-related protein 14 n=1 Tax=Sphagnurus paluster TaxID=117069 RepID=A0A9P7GVR1_9AGAR|nr:hypothetical protein H0H81_005129 [Sphagnurus paluster]